MAHSLFFFLDIFSSVDLKTTKLAGLNDKWILNHLVMLNDIKLTFRWRFGNFLTESIAID